MKIYIHIKPCVYKLERKLISLQLMNGSIHFGVSIHVIEYYTVINKDLVTNSMKIYGWISKAAKEVKINPTTL